jgi:hypothetical protein
VWFEEVARLLDAREFDLSVDRDGSTFPVTARFDRPVLYFGWYSADLNGPFTLPEFRFPPGAIALHLHSYSARTLNAVHQGWTGPLVARGVTATVGNVWEPYLEFTHQPQLLLAALLKGANWGDAAYASLRGLSWHAVTIGDPLYRPFAKTFAQQWADRAELPDEAFSYVVLSELRRLQRDGNVAQAIDEAREIMRTRPSLPVALKMSELLEAQQQSKDAAEAAAWFVSRPNFKPAEVPLAHLAGQLLLRVGDSQRAVQLYEKLLTEPTLVHDFRAVLLKSAVEAAEKTNRADLADAWKAEIARSSAKQ